ncbi:MAG: hypothetical protein MI861_14605, partial [Pirellulales bacterium]|nr:hypothetical protein [Pirellulales bacterium]
MKTSELIEALINESISEAQFEELTARLKQDPDARRLYLASLEVESLLQEPPKKPETTVAAPAGSGGLTMMEWFHGAAVIAGLLV